MRRIKNSYCVLLWQSLLTIEPELVMFQLFKQMKTVETAEGIKTKHQQLVDLNTVLQFKPSAQ
jgi:hypothetical protein